MENITGVGTTVTIYAIPTYPNGITLSCWPADVDPLDSPAVQLAEWATGANGDMILYKHPVPIEINFSTVAGSEEDKAIEILFDANRVAKNKISYNDVITMVIQYPGGKSVTLTNGFLVRGTPVIGLAGDSHLKTRQWACVFESKVA